MSRRPISDCHEPWEWLLVDSAGWVQPCCWASGRLGNLHEHTIEELWNGPDMVRLRGAIRDGFVDRICRGAGCSFVRDTEKAFGVEAYDYRCRVDEEISLRADGRTEHCVAGWSRPEKWGVWSDGHKATLLLDLDRRPSPDLRIELLCRGLATSATQSPPSGSRLTTSELVAGISVIPIAPNRAHGGP